MSMGGSAMIFTIDGSDLQREGRTASGRRLMHPAALRSAARSGVTGRGPGWPYGSLQLWTWRW